MPDLDSRIILEGDWSSYAIKYRTDLGEAAGGGDRFYVRNDGAAIWMNDSDDKLYPISNAGVLGTGVLGDWYAQYSTGYYQANMYKSILFGYAIAIALVGGNRQKIQCVKYDGTVLLDRNVNDDKGVYTLDSAGNYINTGMLSISPNGKYILVVCKEDTTNAGLVFVYEGS